MANKRDALRNGKTLNSYGSTDDTANERARRTLTSPTGDLDSLVGESLLPTDGEDDQQSLGPLRALLFGGSSGARANGARIARSRSEESDYNDDETAKSVIGRYCCCCGSWLRESHPMVHVMMLVGTLSIAFFMVTIFVYPETRHSSMAWEAAHMMNGESFDMPFEQADRAKYNDSVAHIMDTTLFQPKLLSKGSSPSRTFVFPFPTGAFWTNLVLAPTADQGLSYPVAVYPYAYKWSESQLQASYPAMHRKEEPTMIHDYFFPDLKLTVDENVSVRHIQRFDPLSVTLRFSAMNNGFFESYLVQGSPYITVKFEKVTPVVHSLSLFSNIMCPNDDDAASNTSTSGNSAHRRRLRYGVCYSALSQKQGNDEVILTGVQFILQTPEGVNWIVFASEPISFAFDRRIKTTIQASTIFSGVLRFAIIPDIASGGNNTDGVAAGPRISASTGLQRLVYHAGVYPTSGSVSWSFRSASASSSIVLKTDLASAANKAAGDAANSPSATTTSSSTSGGAGRIGTIRFDFGVQAFSEPSGTTGNTELLMMALPHHAQSLPSSSQLGHDKFDLTYKCIKGTMQPVLGSSWSYDEPLPTLGFDGDRGSNDRKEYLKPGVRDIILNNLEKDVDVALPTVDENVYGFGKQSARLAQLALIASRIRQASSPSKSENSSSIDNDKDNRAQQVLDRATNALEVALSAFLNANVTDGLVFDANLGGLVTVNGLKDKSADFGNGRYNDHLFHYGYIMYACAVLGRLRPSFVAAYGDRVDAIYLDVAHISNWDSTRSDSIFFPGARHKVWFDGHSFASGLFPFGNGKSQESSSEAVNCYYGAYMWSLVRDASAQSPTSDTSTKTDFARLLLATEIRGAQTYWHMIPPTHANATSIESAPTVYSSKFSSNFMVGNLGMLDAICSTWFGTSLLYVSMINFMPVTSITGNLFDQDYASLEYRNILEPLGHVEMAWRGYVVAHHAIVDPATAWRDAQDLVSGELDAAVSKTQILYWISSRRGFNASETETAKDRTSSNGRHSSSAACQSHDKCAGLDGLCCPASNGITLDCCDAR